MTDHEITQECEKRFQNGKAGHVQIVGRGGVLLRTGTNARVEAACADAALGERVFARRKKSCVNRWEWKEIKP